MRTGRCASAGKTSNAAANRELALHLNRLAPLVADADQVRGQVLHRHLIVHFESQRQLPARRRVAGTQQRRLHRSHGQREAPARHAVERDGARGLQLRVRREVLPGQRIERRQQQRRRRAAARLQHMVEGLEQPVQRLGRLRRVGHHQDRLLQRLP
jgi:hypothetical protein